MNKKITTFVLSAAFVVCGLVSASSVMKGEKPAELLISNIEALAGEHGAGESTANKKCPIWNVEVKNEIGTGNLGTSITCTTGGEYKCEEGTCPHATSAS